MITEKIYLICWGQLIFKISNSYNTIFLQIIQYVIIKSICNIKNKTQFFHKTNEHILKDTKKSIEAILNKPTATFEEILKYQTGIGKIVLPLSQFIPKLIRSAGC